MKWKIWEKYKSKNRYISLFAKSVTAFILIGVIPLMIMGISIYNAYLGSIKETILSNMYRTTLSIGRNLDNILGEMEENTQYLYTYKTPEYGYLYELLADTSINENRKNMLVTDVLRNILYLNQHIDHVFFVQADGTVYSAMRSPENVIDEEKVREWHKEYFDSDSKEMRLISTHVSDYYRGSEKEEFSVCRNIMNTQTIQSANSEILGTLYIDISKKYLDSIINETKLEDGSKVYIIDTEKEEFAYCPEAEEDETGKILHYLENMDEKYQFIQAGADYYIYSRVPGTDWMVIEMIPLFNLENSYQRIRNTTLSIICISACLLLIVYYFYSKKTNKPIRNLKEAMESIQSGNLDTRVEIRTNDEIGFLASGLNSMTEKLQSHIQKVYIAEIRQKEAEIEALKTQIQPHYLYNTLDVIRMTAITHDDEETAEMIDGLSGQLKYLIGGVRDMVSLQAEIDSVRNYFKIIRLRYENRFSLEIDIDDNLMKLEVPQLILQPIVENAVKHGLRPKEGPGVVGIHAVCQEDILEITVMDNGVGIRQEQLEDIRRTLENRETVNHPKSKSASIGIKNVCDRIRLIYGEPYRMEISSVENIGTIVKCIVPVSQEQGKTGGEHV